MKMIKSLLLGMFIVPQRILLWMMLLASSAAIAKQLPANWKELHASIAPFSNIQPTNVRPFPDGLPVCLEDDFRQLEALYDATVGENWINHANWFTNPDMRQWYGVILDETGCNVLRLHLNRNNLAGTLPTLNLPNLSFFRVDSNALQGEIPLFDCPNMAILDLRFNQLTGSIPNFELSQLRTLGLGSNQLTGSIPNFNLPLLENLWVEHNQLTGELPNWNAPNLSSVIAWNNQLTGSIPNWNLPNLKYIGLSDNQLTGTLPNWNMPKLESMYLFRNQLTGTLPNWNMPNLKQMSLSINQLTGILPNWNMPKLEIMFLSRNQLTGTLPNWNMPLLRYLEIWENQLTGSIPNWNMPKLESMFLFRNQLTGTTPTFATLQKLKKLYLWENQLTGTIPNFNLPLLETLIIRHNLLTGAIPNFNLPNLVELSLRNNQLTGAIPDFNLPKLRYMQMDANNLSGNVPTFSRCAFATAPDAFLALSDNQFNFGNLEHKPWLTVPNLRYAPQQKVPISINGNTITVQAGTGTGLKYIWYKDGTLIAETLINQLTTQGTGTYYCEVTHPTLTDGSIDVKNLILRSNNLAITPCTAPAVSLTLITYNSARASWTRPVETGTGYELRYRAAGTELWATKTALNTATFIDLTGLTIGTVYEYQFLLKCTANNFSPYSETATFSTLSCSAPQTFVSNPTLSSFQVNWMSQTSVGYELRYRIRGATAWITPIKTALGTATFINLTGLQSGTTYEYEVRKKCTPTTFSNYAGTAEGSTLPCAEVPSLALSTIRTIPTRITVNWGAVQGAVGYEIGFKLPNQTAYSVQTALATATTLNLNNLLANTLYDIRVRVKCSTTGFSSGTVRQQTTGCPKVATAPIISHIGMKSAYFKWAAAGNVSLFRLEYKKSTDLTWRSTGLVYRDIYLPDALEPNTQYQARVKTVCDNLNGIEGIESPIAAFKTLPNICNETIEPNNTLQTAKTLSLTASVRAKLSTPTDQDWFNLTTNAFTDVYLSDLSADYNLYAYNLAGSLLAASETQGTYREAVHLPAGSYKILVRSASGASDATNCYNLAAYQRILSPVVGLSREESMPILLEELPLADRWTVAPNPTQGMVTLFLDNVASSTGDLTVSDYTGRILFRQSDVSLTAGRQQYELNLNEFQDGIYLIRLVQGDSQRVQKIFLKK